MEPVQETVTNAPTPSRTIRVTHEGDYNVSVNHGVTQAENGRRFLVFASVEDAMKAYQELKDSSVKAAYLTYSLFVKSQEEMTVESLNSQVLALVPDAHVTYSRVDDNLHTGKVVVDLLTDYQSVKAASTDSLRFFHFDPKRVRPRREQGDAQAPAQGGQWNQVVRGRGQRVQNQAPVQGGQQRNQGQGGQQRNQGQGGQQRNQGQGGQQRNQGQGGRGGQRQGGRGPRQGRGGNTNAV
jgi:hypothetical protein